jgi:hypothetical protein
MGKIRDSVDALDAEEQQLQDRLVDIRKEKRALRSRCPHTAKQIRENDGVEVWWYCSECGAGRKNTPLKQKA